MIKMYVKTYSLKAQYSLLYIRSIIAILVYNNTVRKKKVEENVVYSIQAGRY